MAPLAPPPGSATAFYTKPVADLRGRKGCPPGGQNFFIFMQFSVKIDKNHRLAPPPPRSWRPLPRGNSGSATANLLNI